MLPALLLVLNYVARPSILSDAYRRGTSRAFVVARANNEVKLATDIKGAVVWDLRTAKVDDIDEISAMAGARIPKEILATLISGGFCMVGESGGQLISASLVHTFNFLKDKAKGLAGGLDQGADIVAILALSNAPEEVREKTALGSLKKLKSAFVVEASCR